MDTPTPVYRLHLKTSTEDRESLVQFCLDHNLLGMGWPGENREMSWEDYCATAEEWYKAGVNPSVCPCTTSLTARSSGRRIRSATSTSRSSSGRGGT